MGYCSDVSIICKEKVFEELKNAWISVDLKPDRILNNGDEYIVEWYSLKWYRGYTDVEAIEKVLSTYGMEDYCTQEEYAYKQIIVGEDNATEEYANEIGYDVYDCDFYTSVVIEHPSGFVEIA